MKNRIILSCILSVCISRVVSAEDTERYFRFTIRSKTELDRLTHVISIDNVRGDTVYAYANAAEWRAVEGLGYRFELLPPPSSLHIHEMADSRMAMLEWDRYPTYAAYLQTMRAYADSFPAICKIDTIGYSVQNRLLLAVKISDNVRVNEGEPEFLYTSSMHGDELVGYVLMLRFIDYLLHNYGQPTTEGERVTRLVNNLEIYINPLANPDGTYRLGGDTTVSRATRGNANGTDLNRNFPDRTRDSNTTAGRAKETQEFMRWTAKRNFTLSANFHGGAQVANYPWDNGAPSGTYSACPDDQWATAVSRVYATQNPDLMSGGFTNGITNGCAWYAVFGGRQDWIYYWYGGRELTIELWNTKTPAGSLLPQRWANNKESFLAYLEQALKGVGGVVTEASSGRPLRARVDIQQIPNTPVFSDSAVGDYHRLLLPGIYTVTVSATGYYSQTLSHVAVTDSVATRLDVALVPNLTAVASYALPGRPELMQNFPNPFNPTTSFEFSVPSGRDLAGGGRVPSFDGSTSLTTRLVTLRVYDVLGREVATLVNEVKQPGTYTVQWDATGQASGVYFYRLKAGEYSQIRRMLLIK